MQAELRLAIPAGARKIIERHPCFRPPLAGRASTRRETAACFVTADPALAGGGESLRDPVFRSEIRRTRRRVSLGHATEVEIVFEGVLIAGEVREPVSELGIALLGGSREPLYRLALDLHAMSPLTILVESRAERGSRLRAGASPRPVKAQAPVLDAGSTLHDAVRRIFGVVLAQILANQAVLQGGDPEGVHQMRVAVRRLRSALGLLARYLEPHAAARYGALAAELGRVLGVARDWGVFLQETLPNAAAAGQAPLLAPLWAAAEAQLQRTQEGAERAVADPAFTGLALALFAWVEGSAWAPAGRRKKPWLEQPIIVLAPAMLDRLARSVARRGKHVGDDDPEALHQLRKSLKRLRYGVEFLGSLYPLARVRRFLRACGALLEALGAINDMESAGNLAEQAVERGGQDLEPQARLIREWSEKRSAEANATVKDLWRRFEEAERFWE